MSEIPKDHYKIGGLETIDIIKAKLSAEEFKGFCKGNVYKYLTRSGHKDDETKDLQKAQEYLTWLIVHVGESRNK